MTLKPGTRLGPYEILSPLGAGGMGEVYRARDTRLGRDVAVKVLPQHLSTNPEVRARFEREARSISSLNHPHICALYDVGREEDTDEIGICFFPDVSLCRRKWRVNPEMRGWDERFKQSPAERRLAGRGSGISQWQGRPISRNRGKSRRRDIGRG
ncbi:MAG: protein kinase [Acidobacteriota bacterium]